MDFFICLPTLKNSQMFTETKHFLPNDRYFQQRWTDVLMSVNRLKLSSIKRVTFHFVDMWIVFTNKLRSNKICCKYVAGLVRLHLMMGFVALLINTSMLYKIYWYFIDILLLTWPQWSPCGQNKRCYVYYSIITTEKWTYLGRGIFDNGYRHAHSRYIYYFVFKVYHSTVVPTKRDSNALSAIAKLTLTWTLHLS